jgi:hypothetical protein
MDKSMHRLRAQERERQIVNACNLGIELWLLLGLFCITLARKNTGRSTFKLNRLSLCSLPDSKSSPSLLCSECPWLEHRIRIL